MQRCLGCMKEYEAEFDLCPFCGYIKDTPAKSRNHLEPGTEIANRYIIGKSLGQGGFGITYIAWDNKIQKTVTIKEFFPNALSTRGSGEVSVSCFNDRAEAHFKEGMKKMLDEGRRLSKFTDNENIVDVYDFFEENNTSYIVMEYLSGKDLKQFLEEKGGKLDPEEAVKIILPILNALSDMHKAQLIHRDVAPDNIFLCDNGKIKLLDFGSARLAVDENEKSLSIMLKHGFAPKEQYSSRSKQGPWTDVYAVCATLYRMITGEVPPDSIDRKSDSLKPLSSFGINGYAALEEVISKGLEVEAEDRYQDMKTLKKELVLGLEKKNSIITKKESDNPAKTNNTNGKKNGKKIIIAAVAALVLVAGLVSGAVFSSKFKKDSTDTSTESSTSTTTNSFINNAYTTDSVFAEITSQPLTAVEGTTEVSELDEEMIYEEFLSSDKLYLTHSAINAFIKKDLSLLKAKDKEEHGLNEYGVNESSYTITKNYFDLDNDKTKELLLSIDFGSKWQESVYLFDIDENNNVFEGGSWLGLQNSRCYNKLLLMKDGKNYYFVEFASDGQFEKTCEKKIYNGTELVRKFSLSIPDYNLILYSDPLFAKCTSKNKSLHMASSANYPSDDEIIYISYEDACKEWANLFNKTQVIGYCCEASNDKYEDNSIKLLDKGTIASITWKLYENGYLLLEGKGEMPYITRDDSNSDLSWLKYKNKINYVYVSEGITTISGDAFRECKNLFQIIIPHGVTRIEDYAFESCENIQWIELPETVTEIGTSAFVYCEKLESINIPYGVTSIRYTTFLGCSNLKEIIIPESVTEIVNYAFWYCTSLKSVIIPNSVTSIGQGAFYGCTSLESITIPRSVKTIDSKVFLDCTKLKDIYYSGSQLEWLAIQINIDNKELFNATIHYNS